MLKLGKKIIADDKDAEEEESKLLLGSHKTEILSGNDKTELLMVNGGMTPANANCSSSTFSSSSWTSEISKSVLNPSSPIFLLSSEREAKEAEEEVDEGEIGKMKINQSLPLSSAATSGTTSFNHPSEIVNNRDEDFPSSETNNNTTQRNGSTMTESTQEEEEEYNPVEASSSLADFWPFPCNRFASYVILTAVGTASKLWMSKLSKLKIHGAHEKFLQALSLKRPILTLANHISMADDPLIPAAILPWKNILNPLMEGMRWAPCAVDICYSRARDAWFFANGQSIPFWRDRRGVYQRGVDFCIEKLNASQWVHIYPEGKCMTAYEPMRLKWGIGRMLAEARKKVTLIPIYHMGMDELLPMIEPYIPQIGKRITIMLGEPVEYTPMLDKLQEQGASEESQRKALTDLCQEKLYELLPLCRQIHEVRKD